MNHRFVLVFGGLFFLMTTFIPTTKGEETRIEDGKKVQIDYTLKVDGEVIETSIGKTPLEYIHGMGQIIPGLSSALEGLQVGNEKMVIVQPEDAYGEVNPDAFQEVPKSSLPQDFEPEVGMVMELQDPDQGTILGIVWEVKEDSVVINFNHPMAGKILEFDVKIVSVE